VGSMYDSCNLTCHITRKTQDNYVVLKKVQFALLSKIRERKRVAMANASRGFLLLRGS